MNKTPPIVRVNSASGITLARMCVLASGVASGVVTARALGPDGRGQYFAATTAALVVAQALNLGLTSSNVFLGARDSRVIWPLLVNGVWLTVGALLAGVVAVSICGQHFSQWTIVPGRMLLAVCILGAATLLWNLTISLLVAMERFAALNLWQITNAVLTLAAILVCAATSASPTQFAFATATAASVTAAGLCFFIARGRGGSGAFSFELARAGLGFSFRAYGALLLAYFLQRAGAGLLAVHGRPAQLGEYSIASQIFDVLMIIPTSVGMVIFPALVRRQEDSWQQVRRTFELTSALMLFLCVIAAGTAPWIIPFVFGPRYAGATQILWCLLPAVLAYSMTSVLSQYLVAHGFPWLLVLAWALGLGAALTFGAVLTPRYGANGAALAQSLGTSLACLAIVYLAARRAALHRPPGGAV